MNSLQVWLDALILDRQASGIGQYVRSLYEAYAAEFPEDTIYGLVQPDVSIDGIPLQVMGKAMGSAGRLWFEQTRLPALIKSQAYDVVHFPDYQVPLMARLPRSVMTVHDLAAFVLPDVFPSSKARTKRWLMRQSVRRVSHIIVPSEATKRDLVSILAVPPDRISVVFHGVKRRGVAPAERAHPRPYFLAVGTIEPRKNFARLIQAYHLLTERLGDVPDLLIAGRPGWMYGETLAMPEKLGVAHRVKFLQYVCEDMLAALYRDALALVYPSLYEGFGLPVIEAMWDGVPVVTSRQGALAEVGRDLVWPVDPYDPESIAEQMALVLPGGSEVRQRTDAAQTWARQLTWQRAAALTRTVFQHVMQGG